MFLFPRGSIFRSERQTTRGRDSPERALSGRRKGRLGRFMSRISTSWPAPMMQAGEKDDADGINLLRRNPLHRGCLDHEDAHPRLLQKAEGKVLDECVALVQGSYCEPCPFYGFEDVDAGPLHGRPALFRVPAGPVFRAGRADRAWTGPVSEGLIKAGKEGLPLRRKHPLLEIAGRRFAFEEEGMGIVLKDASRLLGRRRVGRAGGTAEMGASESASEGGPIGHMDLLDRDRKDAFEAEVADF